MTTYKSERGDIAIATTGDTMLTRRLSVYDEEPYLALVKILREADAAFTNLETTVHEYNECTPGLTRGTYMTTEPHLLEDLKWMGINMVSCANNHAFNFGQEGIHSTIRYLDKAGITHAGTGLNLAEARAPGYLDTRNGRVGLIAATAFFQPFEAAAEQRMDVKGRPGINPLRFDKTYKLDRQAFAEFLRVNHALGFDRQKERAERHTYSDKDMPQDREKEMTFLGGKFVEGEQFSVSTQADKSDVEGVLKWVREARRQAEWVVVSLHCHEYGGASLFNAKANVELEEMAQFFVDVAHQCIDNGADVIAGHGSHFPLGVEIYKERPIFYSAGNFIFQVETARFLADDAYTRFGLPWNATPSDWLEARNKNDTRGHPAFAPFWQNIAGVTHFKSRKLDRVELYPIDQGYRRAWAQRGRPVLAKGELANNILERVSQLSRHYGTDIKIENEVGVIRS
jgi:poly-gamma-glutamate capsule biosynthesis protein CapA/YwtB (metallophosphatase superfamily)